MGQRVVALGEVADDGSSLWVADPWNVRMRRFEGGEVVLMPPLTGAGSGRRVVSGVWTGTSFQEPSATAADLGGVVPSWESATHLERPADLGLHGYRALNDSIARATPSPVIASGGSDQALWFYVLFLSPELAAVLGNLHVRTRVFTAVVPEPPSRS